MEREHTSRSVRQFFEFTGQVSYEWDFRAGRSSYEWGLANPHAKKDGKSPQSLGSGPQRSFADPLSCTTSRVMALLQQIIRWRPEEESEDNRAYRQARDHVFCRRPFKNQSHLPILTFVEAPGF